MTTIPVKNYVTTSKIPGAKYVINPYVGCPHQCLYCYAAFMQKFTNHREPWGQFIDVKQCDKKLSPRQLFHQSVLLSSVTDPYNCVEKKYEVTRRLLEQLVHCQAYVTILTKSALVTRDIALLKQLPQCEVILSFSTVDETLRKRIEPGTSTIQEKISALKALHQADIDTAVMAAPLLPGISDWKAIVEHTAPYVKRFQFDSLNMRKTLEPKLFKFVGTYYPHLLTLYREIYKKDNQDYWEQLSTEILQFCTTNQIQGEVFFGRESDDPALSTSPQKRREGYNTPPTEPQLF